MKSRPIDPRDQTSEVLVPVYRVYFHGPWGTSDEWEISGAREVDEVLAWAHEKADGRTSVLYLVSSLGGEVCLHRLRGWDPNDTHPSEGGASLLFLPPEAPAAPGPPQE